MVVVVVLLEEALLAVGGRRLRFIRMAHFPGGALPEIRGNLAGVNSHVRRRRARPGGGQVRGVRAPATADSSTNAIAVAFEVRVVAVFLRVVVVVVASVAVHAVVVVPRDHQLQRHPRPEFGGAGRVPGRAPTRRCRRRDDQPGDLCRAAAAGSTGRSADPVVAAVPAADDVPVQGMVRAVTVRGMLMVMMMMMIRSEGFP